MLHEALCAKIVANSLIRPRDISVSTSFASIHAIIGVSAHGSSLTHPKAYANLIAIWSLFLVVRSFETRNRFRYALLWPCTLLCAADRLVGVNK